SRRAVLNCLDKKTGPAGIGKFHDLELKWTYALLFAPYGSSAGFKNGKKLVVQRASGVRFVDHEKEYGHSPLSEVRSTPDKVIDPRKDLARSAITKSIKHIAMTWCMYCPLGIRDPNPNVGMDKLIGLGPPYLLDLKIILGSVYDYGIHWNNSYEPFEVYGDRLRQLKEHLDSNKLKGIRQLWKDGRDSLQWWTLWGVLFFAGFSLFFAIASFATSVARTVAGFKGIGSH
ncbi:MAG: hypothetical protein M1830_004625, partial [Pleopsidium flavum]